MNQYHGNPYVTRSQLQQPNPYEQYQQTGNHPAKQPLLNHLIYPPLLTNQTQNNNKKSKHTNTRHQTQNLIDQVEEQQNRQYILFITQKIQTMRAQNNSNICPSCENRITYPIIKKVVGNVSIGYCFCLFFTTGLCCLFPLCCCSNCKDVQLKCEKCEFTLGVIKAQCC